MATAGAIRELSVKDKEIRRLFVRTCRDCHFKMDASAVAHFIAKVLQTDALHVWLVLGTDNMDRIADGTHPCLNDPQYR